MSEASERFVVGLAGPELTKEERALYGKEPPFGFLLFSRNLVSPRQAAELIAELRALAALSPLLFVDQEGGTVDRLGPLVGCPFPSASRAAEAGSDRVHENAFLMGRACRLLGFDVDLAPCVDLGLPKAGEDILAGRTFGFHVEDVVVGAMVFLHGLARAGVASCLKHFPGLGRGKVDSHLELPVVEADAADLMVIDLLPFLRLSGMTDAVLVSHAAYPGLEPDGLPATFSRAIVALLRGTVGFDGVAISDDLNMGALPGTLPERAARAAAAGLDLLILSRPDGAYEEAVALLRGETREGENPGGTGRLAELRRRCHAAPRTAFSDEAWLRLAENVRTFTELIARPRPPRENAG